MQSQEFDIIIVGAGLIGTSLILALQNQGLRIAVLEKHLPSITLDDAAIDTRPLSLARSSYLALKALSVWPHLQDQAQPIKAVQVSEQGALGATHITAQELAVDALGYVVPFSLLRRVLYQQAVQQSGVTLLPIKQLISIKTSQAGNKVIIDTAKGQQQLSAALLVGCDGTFSAVREMLAIPVEKKDFGQMAVTATLSLGESHQDIAYERFTDNGVIALLPLSDKNKMQCVWTMSQAEFDNNVNQSDSYWLGIIQKAFAGRLTLIHALQRGKHYPLHSILAKEQIGEGVVLLGNAAHSLYPLAAQGFNLGLRDVAVLSELIIEHYETSNELGSLKVLKNYLVKREQDQKRIVQLTNGVHDVFSLQIPFIKKFRGMGLLALDLCLPLKKRLAKRTMGLSGVLPKLMRESGS